MSLFDQVDLLQREWTDQFVQVDDSVAELKRFAGLTGQVKTVNMSGQALVEFDESEDIGWYDIHPQFLSVVTGQTTTEQPADSTPVEETPAATQAEAPPTAEPAATPADTSKLSPLELARMQDASGNTPAPAAGSKPPAKETPAQKTTPAETEDTAAAPTPTADTSNLSPLELARLQDAGGNTPTPATPPAPSAKEEPAQAAPAETEDTAPAPTPTADTSNLSPLELARMQDAGGNTAAAAPDAPAAQEDVVEDAAVESEEVKEEAVAEAETGSATASVEIPDAEGPDRTAAILAACRAQDGG